MANIAKIQVGIDGQVPPPSDMKFLFETSTTQQYTIGQRVCCSNGAVFHYAYALTALTANTFASTATIAAGNKGNYILGSGTTSGYGGVAGDMQCRIKASNAAITENQFQGGQYVIASHTGSLNSIQNLFIKSHPAAATNTECILQLENPVLHPIDSRSSGNLIPNPFYEVQAYDATPEAYAIGLAVTTVAATSYCWLQTWGPNAAKNSAAPTKVGGQIICGSTTGGVVTSAVNPAYYPLVGFAGPVAGAANALTPMFITLVP